MAMISHRPNYWVGGVHRKDGWELTYPLSIEAIDISIYEAQSKPVQLHRKKLKLCVDVYDAWWIKVCQR